MNMITRNMINMKNNGNNCSKHIKVMRDTKDRDTNDIPSHALDKIRNPSEACLPLDLA